MFDIGGGELIVIVLGIILLFGPKKIPEIAQMVGSGMRKIKQAQSQFQSQMDTIKNEIEHTSTLTAEPNKPTVEPMPNSVANKQHDPKLELNPDKDFSIEEPSRN